MSTSRVKDVAALANVSTATVSNALNFPEKVSPRTLAKVHDAIDKLGYVRNDAARQLRVGRSRTIGLVVLDISNPFFTVLARGAETEAELAGNSIMLANSDQKSEREARYLDLFEEQRVRGVLISPLREVGDKLDRLRRMGTPAVLVDRQAEEGTQYSSVAMDDVAGGALAATHLIEQGCKRIAFVGGQRNLRQTKDRQLGAQAVISGSPGVTLELLAPKDLTLGSARSVGEDILARAPQDRPDGIFAANDLYAVGILQALIYLGGLRVPEDIALVGYDDIEFAAASIVPISSIRQPSELIGRTAVRLLENEIAANGDPAFQQENIVFTPELIVRESSLRR